MANITLKGNPIETVGELPKVGSKAPSFSLVAHDLSEMSSDSFKDKQLVLNIFPSVDTGTCAMSVRKFNEAASKLDNTEIICVSADLPFAAARFCGAEGIENVKTGSVFRQPAFGSDYGVTIKNGPLEGLLSRSIVVIDASGTVKYTEQVEETTEEPNYDAALAAIE